MSYEVCDMTVTVTMPFDVVLQVANCYRGFLFEFADWMVKDRYQMRKHLAFDFQKLLQARDSES